MAIGCESGYRRQIMHGEKSRRVSHTNEVRPSFSYDWQNESCRRRITANAVRSFSAPKGLPPKMIRTAQDYHYSSSSTT
jgi:hypothetical protein